MNIRYNPDFLGCIGTDGVFCHFDTAIHGIRAGCRILLTYFKRYKLNTVRGIVNRWAPPVENDTESYIAAVCKRMAVTDEQPLVPDTGTLTNLIRAIIRQENGIQPYDHDTIEAGVKLALEVA